MYLCVKGMVIVYQQIYRPSDSNKTKTSILKRHDVSAITFIRYAQCQKIGKPNNFKVFGTLKTKGTKQDSQNRLRSPMPEGGVP